MSNDWYSYGQITFKRKHVHFVLDNAESFKYGRWPHEPRETGYMDAPISALHTKAEGYQVKPSVILAEIEQRLEQCGSDGHITLAHYVDGISLGRLAKALNVSEYDLQYLMNGAIAYASSGLCRRWVTCENCLIKKTCLREQDHKPVSYKNWKAHRRR